jgi:hypothetical protein
MNDRDDNYCSALIDAIYKRDYAKIEKVIATGVDLNLNNALWHAVNSENLRTVNILIKQGTTTSENCGLALINAYDGFIEYSFDGIECYMMGLDNICLPDVMPLAMMEKDFEQINDNEDARKIFGYDPGMNVFLEHRNVMFDIMICLIKAGADLTLEHTNISPFGESLRDNHPYDQNDDYICTILDSVLDMESIAIAAVEKINSQFETFTLPAGTRSKEECVGAMCDFLNLIIKIKLELLQAKS